MSDERRAAAESPTNTLELWNRVQIDLVVVGADSQVLAVWGEFEILNPLL